MHEVAPADELDAALERVVAGLLQGAPAAQGRAKRLIGEVNARAVDEEVMALTARTIAEARASPEGREGVSAFLDKRPPSWRR